MLRKYEREINIAKKLHKFFPKFLIIMLKRATYNKWLNEWLYN